MISVRANSLISIVIVLQLFWFLYAEVRSTSAEFEKRYKELMKQRMHYKKATDNYEKKLQAHNLLQEHHNEMGSQLQKMKFKLEEVGYQSIKHLAL